jgi:hypothetical protein
MTLLREAAAAARLQAAPPSERTTIVVNWVKNNGRAEYIKMRTVSVQGIRARK